MTFESEYLSDCQCWSTSVISLLLPNLPSQYEVYSHSRQYKQYWGVHPYYISDLIDLFTERVDRHVFRAFEEFHLTRESRDFQ
jgi:hypothetical protein